MTDPTTRIWPKVARDPKDMDARYRAKGWIPPDLAARLEAALEAFLVPAGEPQTARNANGLALLAELRAES